MTGGFLKFDRATLPFLIIDMRHGDPPSIPLLIPYESCRFYGTGAGSPDDIIFLLTYYFYSAFNSLNIYKVGGGGGGGE